MNRFPSFHQKRRYILSQSLKGLPGSMEHLLRLVEAPAASSLEEADKEEEIVLSPSAVTAEGSSSSADSEVAAAEPLALEPVPAAAAATPPPPPLDVPTERVTHVEFGALSFNADFDSGNIAKIEQQSDVDAAKKWKEIQHASSPQPDFRSPTTSGTWRSLAQNATNRTPRPPPLFKVWARADCEGTPFATRSRSWFAFSVRGASANRVLQFEISESARTTTLASPRSASATPLCHSPLPLDLPPLLPVVQSCPTRRSSFGTTCGPSSARCPRSRSGSH